MFSEIRKITYTKNDDGVKIECYLFGDNGELTIMLAYKNDNIIRSQIKWSKEIEDKFDLNCTKIEDIQTNAHYRTILNMATARI